MTTRAFSADDVVLESWKDSRPIAAANGVEALAYLRGVRRGHVILLDLKMPVMDRVDICREQRRRSGHRDIPVVVLSELTRAYLPCVDSLSAFRRLSARYGVYVEPLNARMQ